MKNIINKLLLFVCIGISCILSACEDKDSNTGFSMKIEEFFPLEGLPGTEVNIKGVGFSENSKVFFNETEVEKYVSRSSDLIVVKVPSNASSGRIAVLFDGGYAFSNDDFDFIPGAQIDNLSEEKAPVGSTIYITGKNFSELALDQIKVIFGNVATNPLSVSSSEIIVVVPEGATSGNVIVEFGDIQTIAGPYFTVGEKEISVSDVLINTKSYVRGGGTFKVDDNYIDGTKNGAYLIYSIVPEVDGIYNLIADVSTNQSYNCYMNIDMGNDADKLEEKPTDYNLTQKIENLGGWSAWGSYSWGPFKLYAGTTYYIRVSYQADGTSWVCNLTNLKFHYADDQSVEGIDVDNAPDLPYTLYSNDFNIGESLLPFLKRAEGTNYVKVVDQCAEFYYDPQTMIDHPGERAYKGAEVSCDEYKTTSEGWYGFRFFLPEEKFPKEASGTIISQIFNNGYGNTWAGHLHIDGDKLIIAYRGSSAASAQIDKEICTLEGNKWINLVINFQAGTAGKGHIRVWVGENLSEEQPTLSLENINLGFGAWSDNNTLSDSYFSCKFGLYVADEYERTVRFDDLKVLEGNPTGAFKIVCP